VAEVVKSLEERTLQAFLVVLLTLTGAKTGQKWSNKLHEQPQDIQH
jgi:hypothetical protein